MNDALRNLTAMGTRIALNRLLAEFEPPPLRRVRLKRSNATAVTRAIRATSNDDFVRFASPKSRSAVLLGAFSYLARINEHEEAILALGRKHGTGARFDGLWRRAGDRAGVTLSERAIDVMEKHLAVANGEVLVIHNHPGADFKTWWRTLFGWRPLPSSADRDTALSYNLAAIRRLIAFGHTTRFRWYLVDEGQIAEFFLPSVEKSIAVLERVVQVSRATGGIRM